MLQTLIQYGFLYSRQLGVEKPTVDSQPLDSLLEVPEAKTILNAPKQDTANAEAEALEKSEGAQNA